MEDSRIVGKMMITGWKFSKKDDFIKVNETLYRSIIGKLKYAVHSRPDIVYVVGIVARISSNSK